MATLLRFFLLTLSVIGLAAAPADLLDGKSFAGWEGDTGKVWRISSGAIEAGSLSQPQEKNNFLATVQAYENFDLTLQWKLEGTKGFVNGGVQFRSTRIPNHYEMKGYQADLGAGYDGCLYDESRRNKVLARPDAPTQKKAMKALGEWNDYRIRAEGPRIQIWLNGVQTVDYTETDAAIPQTGLIAVQIHGNATALVRYRNLRIEALPASPATPAPKKVSQLFDGTTLAGWGGDATRFWKVQDGAMVGGGPAQPVDSWLATTRSFENFDLRFKAKTVGKVGTGLFFRSEVAAGKRIAGWECDIGQGYDGGLFKEGPKGGMIAYPTKEKVAATVKAGDWNEYRVRAEGAHLQTWVNGVLMADYHEPAPRRRQGSFALEISSAGGGQAFFKDFAIEELPPSPLEATVLPAPMQRLSSTPQAQARPAAFTDRQFAIAPAEVIVFTGGENMVIEQRQGELEARLTQHGQKLAPKFRHMSWEGDTVFRQNRMMEWGSWRENLVGAGATMVFTWFGQVEALDATRTPADFKAAYATLLQDFAAVTPRLVVIGPAPFEKPTDVRIPDNTGLNARLAEFNEAARSLAQARGLVFVDLFTALKDAPQTLTRDGMHFTTEGSQVVGEAIAQALGSPAPVAPTLRMAIIEKNRLWFDTWRCMNWAFAYGDRTTQPFAKSSADRPSFVDELKKHLPRLEHAEATILAVARGEKAPTPLPPAPPRADPAALSPDEEKANFKLRAGFDVSLFADEKLGVIRPVQIRWDERGRLWVACIPSYPQLQPGEHGNDYILVVEDTDGDGKADKATRFAEGLTMPMGFEFAPAEVGGGIYVLESTQLVHLPDRNHDDHADSRAVLLSGFGTGDTHQNANSLRWGPDGSLWFTQGYHIWSYVETPHGLAELNRSGVWRFNPRTLQLNSFLNESAGGLNCWGTTWDEYGQTFHGSGADMTIWHTTPGLIPTLHALPMPTALAVSRGKSMEPEFLGGSHLPADLSGVLMKSTYFTSQVQLYRLRDQGSSFATTDLGDLMSGGKEFRPVEARLGPDGAIFVADWLNPVIGHYQASYRDPRRDRSHGRIWRVTAQGRPLVSKPDLIHANANEWVRRLSSQEPWERAQAKSLLYRLPAKEAQAALSKVDLKQADLRLLYELSGVFAAHESPQPVIVQRMLSSDDFHWRAWGAHLLCTWGPQLPETLTWLEKAVRDEHPRVRLEAVVACGWQARQGTAAVQVACLALDKPMDPALNHALTLTIHALAPSWKSDLLAGKIGAQVRGDTLTHLIITAKDPQLLIQTRALAEQASNPATRETLLMVLVKSGTGADALVALDRSRSAPAVLLALTERAQLKPTEDYTAIVEALLSGTSPAQQAAFSIFASTRKEHGQTAQLNVLWKTTTLAAEIRGPLLRALARTRGKPFITEITPYLREAALQDVALAALTELDLIAGATEAARRLQTLKAGEPVAPLLQSHLGLKNGSKALATALTANPPGTDQARLALAWLAQIGRDDAELRLALQQAAGFQTTGAVFSDALVKELIGQADANGNAQRGELLFKAAQSACLSCHKVGELGGTIGPDLSALGRAQTKEAIVESVLWPKRQVKEGFMLTVVTTKDGRTLQGYRSSESSETLTLRDFSANALVAVSKRELAARNDAGTIMPDGLTDRLNPAELADLLRYLFELK